MHREHEDRGLANTAMLLMSHLEMVNRSGLVQQLGRTITFYGADLSVSFERDESYTPLKVAVFESKSNNRLMHGLTLLGDTDPHVFHDRCMALLSEMQAAAQNEHDIRFPHKAPRPASASKSMIVDPAVIEGIADILGLYSIHDFKVDESSTYLLRMLWLGRFDKMSQHDRLFLSLLTELYLSREPFYQAPIAGECIMVDQDHRLLASRVINDFLRSRFPESPRMDKKKGILSSMFSWLSRA